MSKVLYKLKEPIEFGSETITELEFKKPVIGDIKHMRLESPTLADILGLASKLSATSQNIIDKLGIEDGLEVANIMGNFLTPSQKIGKKASE